MELLFGLFSLIAGVLIALFIQGVNSKRTQQFKTGFLLIILSFVCGLIIMAAAMFSS